MTITKTTTPYEFLVRWRDGTLAGAHIRFLETIKDGAEVLTQKEGNAHPVSVAGSSGFPLEEILTAMQTQALVERDEALAAKAAAESALAAEQAKVTTLTAEKADLQSSLDTKTAELATANADRAAEVATLQARITELEANVATAPPSAEVTMRQARLALLQQGLLDDVLLAIEGLPEPQKTAAKIEWEYSNTVRRDHNFTKQMMAMLGMTELQGDELFSRAATL